MYENIWLIVNRFEKVGYKLVICYQQLTVWVWKWSIKNEYFYCIFWYVGSLTLMIQITLRKCYSHYYNQTPQLIFCLIKHPRFPQMLNVISKCYSPHETNVSTENSSSIYIDLFRICALCSIWSLLKVHLIQLIST